MTAYIQSLMDEGLTIGSILRYWIQYWIQNRCWTHLLLPSNPNWILVSETRILQCFLFCATSHQLLTSSSRISASTFFIQRYHHTYVSLLVHECFDNSSRYCTFTLISLEVIQPRIRCALCSCIMLGWANSSSISTFLRILHDPSIFKGQLERMHGK